MGKGIASGASKRPVVNTSIIRGSSGSAKAVASLSNGFAVDMPGGTSLTVSCVKCGRIVVTTGPSLGVMVRRSSGVVSRIIIANCVTRGGTDLANSMTIIGVGRITSVPANGIVSNLRNQMTNVGMAASNGPNKKGASAGLHNVAAVGGSSPLCIVSNVRARSGITSVVSSGSIRSVRILGSTTSTTVCNTRTTGNIVVVAAGHTGRNSIGIDFSVSLATRAFTNNISVLSTCR